MHKNKSKFLPWIIWGFGALFYFYEFLLQVSPSVMVPDLMRDFAITATALSNIAAVYFYAYAGMQIPVGILLDRFGSRKLLTIAAAICALGCVLFASTHSFHSALFARALIGCGSAFAAVGCLNLAAKWFSPKRFALATGLMLTIGMLGAVGGEAPLAFMVHYLTWRTTLHILALAGFILSILIWLIVRDKPTQHKQISSHQAPLLKGLKYVLTSKQSWIMAAYGGLMFAPTTIFGALWGVPYLIRAYHITRPAAAGIVSSIFIGWAVGSPFFGWLSDFICRRKTPMIIGSIGSLITISCVLYIPGLTKPLLIMNLFGFGFFSSGFVMAFATVREINPPQYCGTALGFMNMMNMIGAAVAQPAVGFVLDHFWHGVTRHGARVYTVHAYHFALSSIPCLIIIAIALIPFIKETRCEPTH